jgi:hypothetical protein
MTGPLMFSFLTLHLGALERAPQLLDWVHSWSSPLTICPLWPMEWLTVGQGITGYYPNLDGMIMPKCQVGSGEVLLWSPPPTAAEYALEELDVSRHKRPHSHHLFVCPRLYSHTWHKRLYKLADYVFYLPAGRNSTWPATEYEPLLFGVFLPQLQAPPWVFRLPHLFLRLTLSGTGWDPVMCGNIQRGTRGLFCSNFGRDQGGGVGICRWVWCGSCYKPHQMDNFHVFVPKDESGFVWQKNPKDALKYKTARDGDQLVTPF